MVKLPQMNLQTVFSQVIWCTYVCKEEIPIYTYVPEADCQATLLHPSTVKVSEICEYRFFTLSNTLWVTLHMSNEWLFVTPQMETFTVLCAQGTTTFKLQKEGKLSLRDGCKGYSSHVTLYAISTIETNVTNDYVPSAPINFDNCFEDLKDTPIENLPLHTPLVNVMSSVDDLRIASIKAEVQQLIKVQEFKQDQNLYNMMTSRWTILGTTSLIFMCMLCSCCCSKSCRNCLLGSGTSGTQRVPGIRQKKDVALTAITTVAQRCHTRSTIDPLRQHP
jgi:hypothetical protein